MRKLLLPLIIALVVAAAAVTAATTGQQPAPDSKPSVPRTVPPGLQAPVEQKLVAVSLPFSNRVAYVDVDQLEAHIPPPLDASRIDNPSGLADVGEHGLAVLGTGSNTVSLIAPDSGKILAWEFLPFDEGWYVSVGPDGNLYATGDSNAHGLLVKLDPATLSVLDTVRVGLGQAGMAFSSRGDVWVIGDDASPRFPHNTFSIVDPVAMNAEIFALEGLPEGITPGPDGSMFIALLEGDKVVQVDRSGEVIQEWAAESPWGVFRKGHLLVAISRPSKEQNRAKVLTFDWKEGTLVSELRLPSACRDAREVSVLGHRAVITCVDLPGVVVVDISDHRLLSALRFTPPQGEAFAEFEQPRNPVSVKVALD